MSANEGGEEIRIDDLGSANVHWSEQFLYLLKEHLRNDEIDHEKTISDGLRKTIIVPVLFDYPADEKYSHEKMRPHARECANKAWREAGMPPEMHANTAYLVHLVDRKRCVVFALFEYEYALAFKDTRPSMEDVLEKLVSTHTPCPAGYLGEEVSLTYPAGKAPLEARGIECIIPVGQKQKLIGGGPTRGQPQRKGKQKKQRGKGKRK